LVAFGLAGYFIVSTLTLPLVRHVWVGDVPVFALVQMPKTLVAEWVRTGVIMPLMRQLGGSSGSFSPDYGRAGPYALVVAYLVPLSVAVLCRALSKRRPSFRATGVLLAAECVDLAAVEIFTHCRGLCIY
jgi:hypothetical protein